MNSNKPNPTFWNWLKSSFIKPKGENKEPIVEPEKREVVIKEIVKEIQKEVLVPFPYVKEGKPTKKRRAVFIITPQLRDQLKEFLALRKERNDYSIPSLTDFLQKALLSYQNKELPLTYQLTQEKKNLFINLFLRFTYISNSFEHS